MIILIKTHFSTSAKFHSNIKSGQQKTNSAAQLKILQPIENCGPNKLATTIKRDTKTHTTLAGTIRRQPVHVSYSTTSGKAQLSKKIKVKQAMPHLEHRQGAYLLSSTTSVLVVPRTVHSTIGDRTFPATAASVWNSLLESVRSSPSLQVFRSRLKTELFAWSYSHD